MSDPSLKALPTTAAPHLASPLASCPNCGKDLPVPAEPFCGRCGQEVLIKAPTLLEFIQHFGGHYISTEGALWRSLRKLCEPGALTLAYFRGQRKSFVHPFRLYLSISFIALLLLKIFNGIDDAALNAQLQFTPDLTLSANSFSIKV
ncbi:DUF3667 domain-containing protein [Paucibacter sp. B2R-40]|uniref:DUF3667 domain-containing protein n=1 Tax=Paucibacter sp. B2R-40 TaxID=2893554 RepID=UPI0021E386B4|nr:DUF3667 domain-containing protein [Paucibacter sp. B2R-40]MCV2356325.1 DUF3667 domain-containing protein [Paucibacter sp. B2R-40]